VYFLSHTLSVSVCLSVCLSLSLTHTHTHTYTHTYAGSHPRIEAAQKLLPGFSSSKLVLSPTPSS
jgi:hypothetical protein